MPEKQAVFFPTLIIASYGRMSRKTAPVPCFEKSALYCTRDPSRISRTIIYRNNIDTDPPYWVLLVLRRVEGRFR